MLLFATSFPLPLHNHQAAGPLSAARESRDKQSRTRADRGRGAEACWTDWGGWSWWRNWGADSRRLMIVVVVVENTDRNSREDHNHQCLYLLTEPSLFGGLSISFPLLSLTGCKSAIPTVSLPCCCSLLRSSSQSFHFVSLFRSACASLPDCIYLFIGHFVAGLSGWNFDIRDDGWISQIIRLDFRRFYPLISNNCNQTARIFSIHLSTSLGDQVAMPCHSFDSRFTFSFKFLF